MKYPLFGIAALLSLTSCEHLCAYRTPPAPQPPLSVPESSMVPAHHAAAAARRTPGFVPTPKPKFSGAGTPQFRTASYPEYQQSARTIF